MVLDDLMPGLPAIALDGPKGVGKTATASRRASRTWALDSESQRAIVAAEPSRVAGSGTTFIDEWQHVPAVWDVVRRAVDDYIAYTQHKIPFQYLTFLGAERL